MIEEIIGGTVFDAVKHPDVWFWKEMEDGVYFADIAVDGGPVVEQHWFVGMAGETLDQDQLVANFRTHENAREAKQLYNMLFQVGYRDSQEECYRRKRTKKGGKAYGISEEMPT